MTSELRRFKVSFHELELPSLPLWDTWSWRKEKTQAIPKQLTKPKMRGLHKAVVIKHIIIGFTLAGLSGYTFKVLVADVRKQRYADYHKNCDKEAIFQEMRKKGLFQSC